MKKMLRHIKYSGNNRINLYAYAYMRYTNMICSRHVNLLDEILSQYKEKYKSTIMSKQVEDLLFGDYLIDRIKRINKNYNKLINNFCLI